jgi:hypothetical protein
MPRKKAVAKKTAPAKKRVAKKVAPKVEAPVEVPSKKERMAMARPQLVNPQRTWANVQETEFKSKSWKDWTTEKLGLNKIK